MPERVALARNVCPICWIPLKTGTTVDDEKWKAVQMAFKGKPSFTIRDLSGYKLSRPVYAFGLNRLVYSKKQENAEACHFVHYSQKGNEQYVNDYWNVFSAGAVAQNDIQHHNTSIDIVDKREFCRKLVEHGLLDATQKATVDIFLESQFGDNGNFGNVDLLRQKMTGKFAGCVDCNSKMTVADRLGTVFDMCFDGGGYYNLRGRRTKVKTGEMMQYLMLGCVLQDEDVNFDTAQYTVSSGSMRRKHWVLRFIITWCAIQILFCRWKIGATDYHFQHHLAYIYMGVMDFYISLWLYALHCVGYVENSSHRVDFEEFHYYYTSCYCIYAKRGGARNPLNYNNLECYVLTKCDNERSDTLGGMNPPDPRAVNEHSDIQRRMMAIINDVHSFWDREMKEFCNKIHNSLRPNPPVVSWPDFFLNPTRIRAITTAMREQSNATGLDIGNCCRILGREWYWFHFKHITFAFMTEICRRYDESVRGNTPAHAMRMCLWRRWYRRFAEAVVGMF